MWRTRQRSGWHLTEAKIYAHLTQGRFPDGPYEYRRLAVPVRRVRASARVLLFEHDPPEKETVDEGVRAARLELVGEPAEMPDSEPRPTYYFDARGIKRLFMKRS